MEQENKSPLFVNNVDKRQKQNTLIVTKPLDHLGLKSLYLYFKSKIEMIG